MNELETPELPDEAVRASRSKLQKKQKNLYLSAQARQLLAALSQNMGISETAVVELLVRDKAKLENIVLPSN